MKARVRSKNIVFVFVFGANMTHAQTIDLAHGGSTSVTPSCSKERSTPISQSRTPSRGSNELSENAFHESALKQAVQALFELNELNVDGAAARKVEEGRRDC